MCKKLEEVKELEDFMWLTRKTREGHNRRGRRISMVGTQV